MKQLLRLSKNTPHPAILMITGLAPILAIVHIKSLNMLWRICSDDNSIEYQIIIRQLTMKSWRSLSWVTYIRHILSCYELPDMYIMLQCQSSKPRWKLTCEITVHSHWETRFNHKILLYPSFDASRHPEEKDLGVAFTKDLQFTNHIARAANKGNRVTGAIRCSFRYMDKDMFSQLYKALIRGHLEYANTVWNPIKKGDADHLEKVQRRATTLVPEIRDLPCAERLRVLKLPSLRYRR